MTINIPSCGVDVDLPTGLVVYLGLWVVIGIGGLLMAVAVGPRKKREIDTEDWPPFRR